MRALAWITAIFEEKKRNSRGDGENAESCGTEVRGKNRPANPLWRAILKERLHHLVNNFLTSAPPRETNSGQMPPMSAPAKCACSFGRSPKSRVVLPGVKMAK